MALDSRIKNKDMIDKKIQSEDQVREYKEKIGYLTEQKQTYIDETERKKAVAEAKKNIEITRQKGEELLALLQSAVDASEKDDEYTVEKESGRRR